MVICLERGAETCIQPLPLTISCFNKIQIDFTLLVPAHLGSPRKRAVKRVCACVRVCVCVTAYASFRLPFCRLCLCIFPDLDILTGQTTRTAKRKTVCFFIKVKCAIPNMECRQGARLSSLGREPVGG